MHEIITPDKMPQQSNTPARLFRRYFIQGTYQYIKVIKFKVKPGEKYTLYDCNPAKDPMIEMFITGISPMTDFLGQPETMAGSLRFTTRKRPPKPFVPGEKGECDAMRINLSISENSEHDNLYIVVVSKNPSAVTNVMLKTPADEDKDVLNSIESPFRPQRKNYWGHLKETPVMLVNIEGNLDVDIPDLDSFSGRLLNGDTLTVTLDSAVDKFNDKGWKGENDPLGPLMAGQSYDVSYSAGGWTVKGFHEGTNQIGKWSFKSSEKQVSPKDGILNMWGQKFYFSRNGEVFDMEYGLIGHMK